MPIRMSARLAGVFILLVDDDPDARELLEYALSEAGGTVVTASTAAEALERFKASSPSIVVTDVAMPGRSGFWLVGQIRQLASKPTVPVLAVTGHPFPRDGMLRAGFDDQMLKPVLPDLLYQTLTQLMQKA